MRCSSSKRRGVSSIIGSIFFVLIMIVGITSLVSIFNSFTAYNTQVNKAGNAQVQAQGTSLSISSSSFGAFPPSTTSNFNVATTGCTTTSTLPTNQEGLFYAAGMWWDFFTCNSSFLYSTSFDGVTWEPATTIPNLVSGYTVGPYFTIDIEGSTIYLVIASKSTLRFQLGIGTLASGGTGSAPSGTITWTSQPAEVVTGAQPTGPIQIVVDDSGNEWVAVVQGTCTTATNCQIQIYERQGSCSSVTPANYGWEPNSCSSATAPTNYAPTTPALNALAPNANMILLAPPSTLSSTGAILTYETAGTAVPAGQTGTIAVITQATLGGTPGSGWTTMTLTGITDYSLTSSSAVFIGNTMDFAGLQNAGTGQTMGALKFWTLPFTSMTAATATTEQIIEGGTARAWMAALEASGTTLALFDAYPTAGTIQYYTSSNLGSSGLWSSAITLESAETNVNELSPAAGGFAVTWANSVPNVRFAALSTIIVSNGSSFSVHLVDLYIQNPANSLVAHYYVNSTEDFDYWVGQGSAMTIPIRFIWAAATGYLVTVGTDTGVTTQLTATSPPGANVACPSGSFFSQISPTTVCSGTSGTTPYTISGAGASTCADTTSGSAKMMGFGLSYTTRASSSGNIYVSFAFQVASVAGSGISSAWRLYYGTGTAPSCNAANPAGSTAIGQTYTVKSQSGSVGRVLSQSVSTTLTGLFPSTTYWFDVQATDSSAAQWTYSNPDMGITDVQTTASPNLTTSTNTNTCTDTTLTTAKMMGFGTTFTTGGAGFTGNVFGKLSFNIALNTATSGINTKYTVSFGTGAAPACNAGATGFTAGNQYTMASQATVLGGAAAKASFVLTGLTASTTYWVDVQASDSTVTDQWIYSNPTLAVMEMPTATNSLPNVASSPSSTNTCTDTTANAYIMAGFAVGATGTKYTIPVSAVGDLYITLTFQVTIPSGASGASTQWQVAFETGAPPACGVAGTGTTKGNTYTVNSQSAVAGAIPQSETFVILNVQNVAGTTIWVDIQAFDSTSVGWVFNNPEISVVMFSG